MRFGKTRDYFGMNEKNAKVMLRRNARLALVYTLRSFSGTYDTFCIALSFPRIKVGIALAEFPSVLFITGQEGGRPY